MALDKEIIHKELDLIQDVIKRKSANSFEVKKWLIGILTALLVFKHDEFLGGTSQLGLILLVPVVCFWYLDAFFLSSEKLYREMYKWVVNNRPNTEKYLYDLNTTNRTDASGAVTNLLQPANSIWANMISKTIWPFYAVPILFILSYSLVNLLKAPVVCSCGCIH